MHVPPVLPPPLRRPRRRAAGLVAAVIALTPAVALSLGDPASAPAATSSHHHTRTASREVHRLYDRHAISRSDYRTWRALVLRVRSDIRRLPWGTRRSELAGVLNNTEQIARRGKLSASLAPSVFLTLKVNRDWWTTSSAPPAGSRPEIAGSPLVWQYYPGEGLQIQWLGTFGLANGLATTKTPAKLERLRAIENEALRLASRRAGGPAWQYLFDFGGGAPPWGSGMAQVTGMQSLTRAGVKLGQPRYTKTALEAVALLRHRAPNGALRRLAHGDHILLYTFSRARVLNAFTQAVSGLHEVALTTGDAKVTAGYVRAERELRSELPRYDTGRWARYQLGGANMTVSYMTLTRSLLNGLCAALKQDAAAAAAGQNPPGAPPSATPYCVRAARFTRYLKANPNGPRSTSRGLGAPRGPLTATGGAPVRGPLESGDDPAALVGLPAVARP